MGRVVDIREPIATPGHAASPPPRFPTIPTDRDTLPPLTAAVYAPLPDRFLAWIDAHRRLLFGSLVVLYLLGFNGHWRFEPDSALYMTIGRNLAEGQGYTYHGQPHRLVYPGLPWLFAGLFKLFGTDSRLPGLIVMPLIGALTLGLTYRLFRLHADRATAVLITVLLGMTRTFYRYCFELMSDVPFLMGVMAFLVGFESIFYRREAAIGFAGEGAASDDDDDDRAGGRARSRPTDWLLLVGGLAIVVVTRPTMWALLLAVGAAVFYWMFRRPIRWGRIAMGAGLAGVAGAAALAFILLGPGTHGTAGAYEEDFLNSVTGRADHVVVQVVTRTGPALLQPSASEALFGVDIGSIQLRRLGLASFDIPLALLPSLLVIAAGLALFRRRALWGFFVLFTIAMMLVRVVHVRYFLQVLPLLLYGFWLGVLALHRRLPARWADRAFVALVVLLAGANVVRVVGFVAEQRRTPFLEKYRGGRFAAAVKVADELRARTPAESWVLSRRKTGRILTNLSGRYVAEPDAATEFRPHELQPVYVLEPMDEEGLYWMRQKRIAAGLPVGDPIKGRARRNLAVARGRAPAGAGSGLRRRRYRRRHRARPVGRARVVGVSDTVSRARAAGVRRAGRRLAYAGAIGSGTVVSRGRDGGGGTCRRRRAGRRGGRGRVKFSIVTPSFNAARFLRRTAESILSQPGPFDLQWIVVDGHSTDGTADLLRDLAARDERVVWASEADGGQSHAINKGMAMADGDVLAWLNADDTYAPGALAAVADALARNERAAWTVGRCDVIDADDRPIRARVTRYKDYWLDRYSLRQLLRENFISQPAVFWRRDFGRAAGPLDESLHYTMDYDLWLRMARLRDPLVLPSLVAHFRYHETSKSGRVRREQFDEQYRVASRYFGDDWRSRVVHKFNVEKIVAAYRLMRAVGW